MCDTPSRTMGFLQWLFGIADVVNPIPPQALDSRVRVWADREMASGTVMRIDLGAYPAECVKFTLRDKIHPRTAADSAGRITLRRLLIETSTGTLSPVTNWKGEEGVVLELDDVLTIDLPLVAARMQ